MKYNYPIKYAVMPIKEKEYRDSDWYDVCYVIVKCFVLEEKVEHHADGTKRNKYFVVCPYQRGDSYYDFKKSPPDDYYGEWVRNVYDTYEEALEEKNKRNIDMEPFILDKERRKKELELFKERLELFRQFEKDVEAGTKELKVNSKPEEKYVFNFSLKDNKVHKQERTLYDLIEWSYNELIRNPFIVYHVNPYAFRKLNEMTENESSDISNYTHIPLLMNSKDNEYMKLISPEGNIRYLKCVNNSDHFWERKEVEFLEPESAENFIFTLENYDDIVNAYGLDCKEKILSYRKQHKLMLDKFYKS